MIANEQQLLKEQQERIEKEQLHFSGRIWHELLSKVRPRLFRKALRSQIDLNSYGDGIEKFYFTFIAMNVTPNFQDWIGVSYFPENARIEVAIELPYAELFEASEEEVIRLMEAAYLEGIDEMGKLELASDFDYRAFRRDVEAIFAQERWYELEDETA